MRQLFNWKDTRSSRNSNPIVIVQSSSLVVYFRRARAIALLLTCLALTTNAQTDRATVTGTILDPAGSVVPNASIDILSVATGQHRTTHSTERGVYNIPALPIGTYRMEVSAHGFATEHLDQITLQVGQTQTINVHLQIVATRSTVNVEGESPLVESTAAVGGVVSGSQVQNLPLNGRDWSGLMSLVPGAIDTGTNNQNSVRFAGRGLDDNNFRFDGVDATGIQNQEQRTSVRLQMSTEAIAEFRANSGLYTAESGGSPGGQVDIVSKVGTNQIHGSAFEFLRNSFFDARSFDTRTSSPPPFRLNQFGASIGGPILKDRTFYFLNFEALRQTLGQSLTGVVPSASFRAATLAKSPALKPILDAFPAGMAPTGNPNVDAWFGSGSQTVDETSGLARIDHKINDKTFAFIRFNTDFANLDSPLGGNGGFLLDRLATNVKPTNAIISVQRIISPTALNDFKIGFNRSDWGTNNETNLPYQISVPNFTTLNNYLGQSAVSNSFDILDNFSRTINQHTIKAGVEIRRVQINQSAGLRDDLRISYSSLAGFQNNQASSVTLAAALPVLGLRKTSEYGYIQDEWRPRPNLTVNLGLRYEYYGAFSEVRNRAQVLDPRSCPNGGFCPPGSDFYFPDSHGLASRIAVAWSPTVFHGKTVIRTGYGNFYGEGQLGDLNAPINNEATRLSLTNTFTPGLSFPVQPFLATASNSATPRGLDRYHRNQNVAEWGFSVQHELDPGTVMEVGYLGSKGTHLFERTYVNLVDPLTGTRPDPALGQVDYKTADANSTFHALQVSFRRNLRAGILVSANYQWSHSINDGSVGGGESVAAQNIGCRACDRASSDQDIRHVFTSSFVWKMPAPHWNGFAGTFFRGWELSGIGTARTGRPVTILVTRPPSALPDQNNVNQRPNYVFGIPQLVAVQTPQAWLNPAAYAIPAAGTWGNLGRNTARGPSLWQVDPALTKRTPINDRFSIDFRVEAFNVFNRAQYGDPINNFSNTAQFGSITSPFNTGATGSGTPRQIQFMLRMNY